MKKKVLIIDDSLIYRESLRIVLKDDYEVTECAAEKGIGEILSGSDAELIIFGTDKPLKEFFSALGNIPEKLDDKALITISPENDRAISYFLPFGKVICLARKADSVLSIPDVAESLFNDLKEKRSIAMAPGNAGSGLFINMNPFIGMPANKKLSLLMKTGIPVFFKCARGMRGADVARMIHDGSSMRSFGFLKINGIDEDNGIFSRIVNSLRQDDFICGTLYIENFDALSTESKEQILSLLDGMENLKVDEKEVTDIRLRIIASSRFSLKELLNEKKINDELFYRLSVAEFSLHSLCERADEIPLIVNNLAEFYCSKYSIPFKSFSSSAIDIMQKYIWPSNIDELISVVQRSILFCESDTVNENDVKFMPLKICEDAGGEEISSHSENSVRNPVTESFPETASDRGDEEKLPSDIVINLAHEIKNPLVGIKTFASLLPEKYDDVEFRKDFFQIVNSDIDRIDLLIERIMQYENVNNAVAEEFPLNEVVNEIIEEKKNIFREKSLTVELQLDKDNPKVKFPKKVIKYSIENLLFSLVSYCTRGNIIRIMSQISGDNGFNDKVELKIFVDEKSGELIKKSEELEEMTVILAQKAVGKCEGSVFYLKDIEDSFGYLLSLGKSD